LLSGDDISGASQLKLDRAGKDGSLGCGRSHQSGRERYNLLIKSTNLYIFQYMKTLIVELDDEIAAKLERVAPGRARQRSEFIRNAVRKALWEIEEQATAEAYRRQPDSGDDAYLNADVWEPRPKSRRTRKRR